MPIVIDQVVITVEVGNAPGPSAAGAPGGNSVAAADRQALIAECVEQVLEILRQQREP